MGRRRVIIESPFRGKGKTVEEKWADEARNIEYARSCIRDCLLKGDAPVASHLLFTQPGILDDGVEEERRLGIEAGLSWYQVAQACVVYVDRGLTDGMVEGIRRAGLHGVPVEKRSLQREKAENAA
jgi:hypothetical protein